jgi:Mrr N-terminal domain
VSPTIEIDEEVLALLKQNAEPFVDTPNSVVRRLLGLAESSSNGHKPFETLGADLASPSRRGRKAGTRARRSRRSESKRALAGTILPHEEYELPILAILDQHAGRAPTREVLDELGERLRGKLTPADYEPLSSGDIRWRNRAQFVRLRLTERGDMVKDSPRGLWEITDQGRDKLVSR